MRFIPSLARCFAIGLCGIQLSASGQNYPSNYFRSPLDIPLKLSGTFGELRTNHFHSGLDIRTNSVEGLPVYAAAEGHVSRIKISAYGYGNAIYIDHPNGYTTLYAHLRDFDEPIASWIEQKHYEKKSFELDISLFPNELPVSKGQRIAFSGNTGGSGGPHLHFEVRDTKTEAVINPRHFGFRVADDVAPVIDFVELVPYGATAQIGGSRLPRKIALQRANGQYIGQAQPEILGPVYLQVKTWDKHSGNEFRNGVYQIVLRQGNDTLYHYKADRFEFNETRYANAVMDYEARMLNKEQIYRCFKSAGNLLSMLPRNAPTGLIQIPAGETRTYDLLVTDFDGNAAQAKVQMRGAQQAQANLQESTVSNITERVLPQQAWTWQNDEVQLQMPANNLYDTLNFIYKRSVKPYAMFSSVHSIHDASVPVHAFYDLAIRQTGLIDSLRSKTLLVNININKGRSAFTGKWDGPWFRAKVRGLGDFYLAIDTIAPTIKNVNVRQEGSYSKGQQIRFVLSDNLAGLQSYDLFLGDTWQKAIFDGKTATLSYTFSQKSPKGNLPLRLVVKDAVGNTTSFQTQINSL